MKSEVSKLLWSLIALVLLTVISCNSNTQPAKDILSKYSKPQIDIFFKSINAGTYNDGLINLLKYNSNISLTDSEVIFLEKRFAFINTTSGKFKSDTLLRTNQIGDDLAVYCYLAKYEKNYYRFLFTFYNNGDNAKLIKFSFDNNIGSELEEAIKFYVK